MFTSKIVNDPQDQNKKDPDVKLQDAPVHTMKKDLDDIAHNRFSAKDYTAEKNIPIKTLSPEEKPVQEKSSPFLASQPAEPIEKIPGKPSDSTLERLPYHPSYSPAQSQPQAYSPPAQANRPSTTSSYTSPPAQSMGVPPIAPKNLNKASSGPRIRHTFAWGISIFIILVIGVSAYYFLFANPTIPFLSSEKDNQEVAVEKKSLQDVASQNSSDFEPVDETSKPSLLPEPGNQEPAKTIPPTSTDSVKVITINSQTATVAEIKSKMQEVADSMIQAQASKPTEVTFKDSVSGNPIDFPTFASKFQLIIPASLNAQLDGNYKIFIFIDKMLPRLGMMLAVKDSTASKSVMTSEESNLVKNFKNLFWTSNYQDNINPFSTGNYNNREVRYKNLNSPEELSLDYSVYNNQIVTGTTKMTLRSIMDYIESKNGSPQNIPPNL